MTTFVCTLVWCPVWCHSLAAAVLLAVLLALPTELLNRDASRSGGSTDSTTPDTTHAAPMSCTGWNLRVQFVTWPELNWAQLRGRVACKSVCVRSLNAHGVLKAPHRSFGKVMHIAQIVLLDWHLASCATAAHLVLRIRAANRKLHNRKLWFTMGIITPANGSRKACIIDAEKSGFLVCWP